MLFRLCCIMVYIIISFIDDDKSAVCKVLMLEKELDNFQFNLLNLHINP